VAAEGVISPEAQREDVARDLYTRRDFGFPMHLDFQSFSCHFFSSSVSYFTFSLLLSVLQFFYLCWYVEEQWSFALQEEKCPQRKKENVPAEGGG